ncbi:putative membrane protein [Dehalococcoides mccartyi]|uniref:Putative membrane protein n=1 Tax=Dehalococcoides mccartyi TaxID=61435 RepID=A0A328ELR9_9CHLR|nr:putative membrane protein [Dehalococcoides mccartyi]
MACWAGNLPDTAGGNRLMPLAAGMLANALFSKVNLLE